MVDSQSLPIGKLSGELLASLLSKRISNDPDVVVGPSVGVDAAAISIGGQLLVVKTDPITFAVERAPHFLVNVNANDIACLGATPRWLLVTALLPAGSTTKGSVERLFDELLAACVDRNIELVGGHTEVTAGLDRPILVGQMLGIATPEQLLKPGQARAGDRLMITKPIAIEGTALLARELKSLLSKSVGPELVADAAALLDDPGISVVKDAEVLLGTGWVRALHDPTEGGLAMGIRELAQASNLGAFVSQALIPVLPETRAIAALLLLNPMGMLASGTLLAAIDPAGMLDVDAACKAEGMPHAWIGKLTSLEHGCRIRTDEGERDLYTFDTDEASRALTQRRNSE